MDDPERECTTQFAVIDNNGLIVCVTNSLPNTWGSYICVGGFYLNDALTNFGGEGKNAYEPGKRPRTHFSPIICVGPQGELLAIGTPGGVEAGVATNAALAATATILPASIPQPKIKSIEVKDGIVRLTVARTSKMVRYGVSSGATPATLAADSDFAPQDGDDAGDIVIEAPAKGNSGFFSVGRAPLK
ncbi:MAG: gamma-glutamyltransferase, partial [Kiritimatiellae bacterium]|nr:gamma-glutamyltransferase [Kiritimatiellia bacterium]